MPKNRERPAETSLASSSGSTFRSSLIRESAKWMDARQWDEFATLTFNTEVDETMAAREFERYVRRLEQRSGGRVEYFAVAAKSPVIGRVHVHAMLGFCQRPTARASRAAWRAGHAKITRYQAGRGGIHYIANHVAIPSAEVMLRS